MVEYHMQLQIDLIEIGQCIPTTGLNNKGWGFLISGSSRWSDEGYVPGTYYNAGSYLLSIEKKVNSKHTFNMWDLDHQQFKEGKVLLCKKPMTTGENFTILVRITKLKAMELRKKEMQEIETIISLISLGHYWKISEKLNIQSNLYAITGRTSNSNLNWFNANDPRPDYYKYLPSYYVNNQGSLSGNQVIENQNEYNQILQGWQENDPDITQLNT